MKLRIKAFVLALLALGTIGLLTGCAAEENPYAENDALNYTVSVKYDANGGVFTTNTSTIVDSFDISGMNKNSEGNVELALLSPDDATRGRENAFSATKSGYFLAGWYAERTQTGTDEDGNPIYSYGKKWDFKKDLVAVDASKTYTSTEPVMTLYAAWIPMFEIEVYDLSDGSYIGEYVFNPTEGAEMQIPSWNEETGAVEMYKFPAKTGYTYNGLYLDAEGKNLVTTDTLAHSGVVNLETGVAENHIMKVYMDLQEGEWYRIYNVEQFIENSSVTGCYELYADLDFTDQIWPTKFMYGNFAGTIKGNGHTIKNIEIAQTDNSRTNAGLFGSLTESANISDVTFENITFTIQAGSRVVGSSYGLFAGTISDTAQVSNVNIVDGILKIDSKCYFAFEDYIIGMVCGLGNADVIANADIKCEATGDNPETINITVNGNEVTVEFITQ